MIFYVGIGRNTTTSEIRKVLHESKKYDDIFLGDFLDSPTNITFKTIAEYTWLYQNCDLDYCFHADQDFFINPFRLQKFLETEVDRELRPFYSDLLRSLYNFYQWCKKF